MIDLPKACIRYLAPLSSNGSVVFRLWPRMVRCETLPAPASLATGTA